MTNAIFLNEAMTDEQLDRVNGGGVQAVIPILIKAIPIVAPIIQDAVEKALESHEASAVTDINDSTKTRTTQTKVKTYNTGDRVPQFDLS